MKTSEHGIDLVKIFEGFSAKSYVDVAGYPTIGYGHKIRTGEMFYSVTEEEATRLLGGDLLEAEAAVNKYCTAPINQNQFDALVSFTYNLGGAALEGSTLLRLVNAREYSYAADEFPKWCHAGGVEVEGLVTRREKERALFIMPIDA